MKYSIESHDSIDTSCKTNLFTTMSKGMRKNPKDKDGEGGETRERKKRKKRGERLIMDTLDVHGCMCNIYQLARSILSC